MLETTYKAIVVADTIEEAVTTADAAARRAAGLSEGYDISADREYVTASQSVHPRGERTFPGGLVSEDTLLTVTVSYSLYIKGI